MFLDFDHNGEKNMIKFIVLTGKMSKKAMQYSSRYISEEGISLLMIYSS